jgi:5-methylcytosine-specific restriction endonuclease McrA
VSSLNKAGDYSIQDLIKRDRCVCHLCGRKVNPHLSGMHPKGPTVDHLVPLSAGGDDELSNVALAHRACNVKRGTRGEVQLRLIA